MRHIIAEHNDNKIDEKSQPILPHIIHHGDKDSIIRSFPNDRTYRGGDEAKEAILNALKEQRDAFLQSQSENDFLEIAGTRNFYDSAIEKINNVDVHGLDGSNGSKNSQYILGVASAYNHFSKGDSQFVKGQIVESEPKVLFDPQQFNGLQQSATRGLHDIDFGNMMDDMIERASEGLPERLFPVGQSSSGKPDLRTNKGAGGLSARNSAERPRVTAPTADNTDAVTIAADNITKILQAGGGLAGMIAKAKAAKAAREANGGDVDPSNLGEFAPQNPSGEKSPGTSIERK